MSVVSVADTGDGEHARWTFNTPVTGVTTAAALTVNGDPPDHDIGFSGSTATVGYPSNFVLGDPWVVGAGPAGITFQNGRTLTIGQSGVTT